jgi:hypothetical protein
MATALVFVVIVLLFLALDSYMDWKKERDKRKKKEDQDFE